MSYFKFKQPVRPKISRIGTEFEDLKISAN